jgi:hypothetical protein
MANTRTSTSILSKIEISNYNDINENKKSKKYKITENLRKSFESMIYDSIKTNMFYSKSIF